MSKPSSDSERHMTEMIMMSAMNDRLILKDVKKAVQKAYKEYRKDTLREMDGDFRAFERYMIEEINKRREPVVDDSDIQDYLPHGGLPLGDPRYRRKYSSEDGLRNKVIRLAHENPELRKDLLPLLKENNKNV